MQFESRQMDGIASLYLGGGGMMIPTFSDVGEANMLGSDMGDNCFYFYPLEWLERHLLDNSLTEY